MRSFNDSISLRFSRCSTVSPAHQPVALSAEICPRIPNTLLACLRGVLSLDHFKLQRLSVAFLHAYARAFALVWLDLLCIVPVKIVDIISAENPIFSGHDTA